MRSTVEPAEGNRVKLSIEVDEDEFEKAVDSTFRRLARQVRVPGFRPGKAPRRVVEARIGGARALRQEAMQDALPGYYTTALRDSEVDAIAAPEVEVTGGEESGPLAFDALVQVRPKPTIAGYAGLQVTIPPVEVTDEEVTAQVDRLREQFGELATVSRPARDGDHVTIDIHGYRHTESVPGLTAEDLLVEVGKGTVVPELDEYLRGANPGDIFKFNTTVPSSTGDSGQQGRSSAGMGDEGAPGPDGERSAGEEVSCQVLVKEVKEKILPDADDEWAAEASELETLDELRQDIAKRVETVKRVRSQMTLRDGALRGLVELVEDDAPDVLVGEEMERRLHDLSHRLEAQKLTLVEYLGAVGSSEEHYLAELRSASIAAVKADLALRALADAESIEVTDEELSEEVVRMAEQLERPPDQLRDQLDRGGRLPAVRSDMRNAKALEWLLEHVELVDEEGHLVDRAVLDVPGEPEGSDASEGALEEPEGPPAVQPSAVESTT
jgi:trigger factor